MDVARAVTTSEVAITGKEILEVAVVEVEEEVGVAVDMEVEEDTVEVVDMVAAATEEATATMVETLAMLLGNWFCVLLFPVNVDIVSLRVTNDMMFALGESCDYTSYASN